MHGPPKDVPFKCTVLSKERGREERERERGREERGREEEVEEGRKGRVLINNRGSRCVWRRIKKARCV